MSTCPICARCSTRPSMRSTQFCRRLRRRRHSCRMPMDSPLLKMDAVIASKSALCAHLRRRLANARCRRSPPGSRMTQTHGNRNSNTSGSVSREFVIWFGPRWCRQIQGPHRNRRRWFHSTDAAHCESEIIHGALACRHQPERTVQGIRDAGGCLEHCRQPPRPENAGSACSLGQVDL